MNFYLSAVDDLLRHSDDKPSIGLILCKAKKELVVEYALRGMNAPMGIAEFRHLEKLPEEFKGSSLHRARTSLSPGIRLYGYSSISKCEPGWLVPRPFHSLATRYSR